MTKDEVKAIIDRLGLRPIEFAARIGCTEASVNAWLRGDYEPGRMAKRNIEDYLISEGKVAKNKAG
jgi:DNA-binding transcriptional regulator YiaG